MPKKSKKIKGQRPQVAALPYREGGDGVEVMLVTSRETRRWVIPKGWAERNVLPAVMARTEAYEEAGLMGRVMVESIGFYHYDKRMKTGTIKSCKVDVFALQVTAQLEHWPEKQQRVVRWFSLYEAAMAVQEPELRALMLGFTVPVIGNWADG